MWSVGEEGDGQEAIVQQVYDEIHVRQKRKNVLQKWYFYSVFKTFFFHCIF